MKPPVFTPRTPDPLRGPIKGGVSPLWGGSSGAQTGTPSGDHLRQALLSGQEGGGVGQFGLQENWAGAVAKGGSCQERA